MAQTWNLTTRWNKRMEGTIAIATTEKRKQQFRTCLSQRSPLSLGDGKRYKPKTFRQFPQSLVFLHCFPFLIQWGRSLTFRIITFEISMENYVVSVWSVFTFSFLHLFFQPKTLFALVHQETYTTYMVKSLHSKPEMFACFGKIRIFVPCSAIFMYTWFVFIYSPHLNFDEWKKSIGKHM